MEARASVMKSSWTAICSNSSCLPHFFSAEQQAKLLVTSLLQPEMLQKGKFLDWWLRNKEGEWKRKRNTNGRSWDPLAFQSPKPDVSETFTLNSWRFFLDWPKQSKPKSRFCTFKCILYTLAANSHLAHSFIICISPAKAPLLDAAPLQPSRCSKATFQVMQSKQSC